MRCPECGTLIRRTGHSHVPWVWRQYRGDWAYLSTLWMVVGHPGTMAAEMNVPALMRDARKFYRITRIVAVALGTALLGWGIFQDSDPLLLGRETAGRLIFWETDALTGYGAFRTASVTLDQWYEIFPLAIGMYAAIRMALAMHVWFWTRGFKKRYRQRRAACAAMYFSALCVVQIVLLGVVWALPWQEVDYSHGKWIGRAAGLLALAPYIYAALNYGLRIRPRWRVAPMLAFLPLALLVGDLILLWVHLVFGYLVLAIRSMSV